MLIVRVSWMGIGVWDEGLGRGVEDVERGLGGCHRYSRNERLEIGRADRSMVG